MSGWRPALGKGAKAGLVLAALVLAAAQTGADTRARSQPGPAGSEVAEPAPERFHRGDPVARWRPYVEEASRRFGVPAEWIERVMRAESGGRTTLHDKPIVSRAGAMGLMQIMPATWAQLRARHGFGADPFDPKDNILAGAAYLAEMHAKFGYPGLFGAYNAGPSRYGEWFAGRRGLPAETRLYLARVAGEGAAVARPLTAESAPPLAPDPSPRARLFAVDRAANAASSEAGERQPGGLFVTLSAGAGPAAGEAPEPR